MNKILDKFVKKIEKIKKYGILYQGETEILLTIPIEVEISQLVINKLSFNEVPIVTKKEIASCCLFYTKTTASTTMQKLCAKHNIMTIPLTTDSSTKTPEELEEMIKKAQIRFYNLETKLGDGHS